MKVKQFTLDIVLREHKNPFEVYEELHEEIENLGYSVVSSYTNPADLTEEYRNNCDIVQELEDKQEEFNLIEQFYNEYAELKQIISTVDDLNKLKQLIKSKIEKQEEMKVEYGCADYTIRKGNNGINVEIDAIWYNNKDLFMKHPDMCMLNKKYDSLREELGYV